MYNYNGKKLGFIAWDRREELEKFAMNDAVSYEKFKDSVVIAMYELREKHNRALNGFDYQINEKLIKRIMRKFINTAARRYKQSIKYREFGSACFSDVIDELYPSVIEAANWQISNNGELMQKHFSPNKVG